ncbi:glycosyltransferase [Formosa sp. Hel1_31_208]|uniref:glycosyltransferase family 2 protein n=1 Tax=Formosa sp. Hel1_31_208 TaxID=1798225 RepID=UPI000B8100B4|nr:glycosyltransferase [Formosa sp. Hel1_31_208]
MSNKPLLSVCMITYNHELYIKQAIEGVLMQETSFDFELIVVDDCSPDNTEIIVNSLIETHPQGSLITYTKQTENKGMYDNFLYALNACKSEFVALCEGDDYWIDPKKLQKQVAFLEANPAFEVCFTNTRVINSNTDIVKDQLMGDDRMEIYEHKDLPIWAPTLTRVFRNRDFSTVPSAPGLDNIMLLWQSKFGKIKLLNTVTSAYRLHSGGVYSAQSEGRRKEHMLVTNLVSLGLIEKALYAKYFGMLFKNLIEIYYLDVTMYSANKLKIKNGYRTYKNDMPLSLRLKIQMVFIFLNMNVIWGYKRNKKFILRVLNKVFIY